MNNIKLMSDLKTYDRPLLEVKKYHLIGLPLDGVIPFTFGIITLSLSKIKRLNKIIFTINRFKQKNTNEVLRKWKI